MNNKGCELRSTARCVVRWKNKGCARRPKTCTVWRTEKIVGWKTDRHEYISLPHCYTSPDLILCKAIWVENIRASSSHNPVAVLYSHDHTCAPARGHKRSRTDGQTRTHTNTRTHAHIMHAHKGDRVNTSPWTVKISQGAPLTRNKPRNMSDGSFRVAQQFICHMCAQALAGWVLISRDLPSITPCDGHNTWRLTDRHGDPKAYLSQPTSPLSNYSTFPSFSLQLPRIFYVPDLLMFERCCDQ